MIVVIPICLLLVALLLNGIIQQERARLWKEYRAETAEQRHREIEKKKKAAAEKIKTMLQSRRQGLDGQVSDEQIDQAAAEAAAAMTEASAAERTADAESPEPATAGK